ncbi:14 kDa phosphohistidine phosphatase-like [Anticarsia gemmatalis]|uniref:14 kDa phosphohistidine phosphatase-like n=1 Tax=Anticarsia gemmatalis TaxID=129554 RepID=UPI003F7683D6
MSATLDGVPKVEIEPTGVFKYVMIKVHDTKHPNVEPVTIIRGIQLSYHSDIYDVVQEKLQPLDCEPIGGGRISHDPENKKIFIYGYSQSYGRADHELTAKLIKKAYPDYSISITDDEY